MRAITLNTLSRAVTEYDDWVFNSITPTHAAGESGLYRLGGDADNGKPIVSRVTTGLQQWGSSKKKRIQLVYFAIQGEGSCDLHIGTPTREHKYRFTMRPSGETRCQPGKGIRENYLSFGFSNPDGDAFTLDRIEALVAESASRRV